MADLSLPESFRLESDNILDPVFTVEEIEHSETQKDVQEKKNETGGLPDWQYQLMHESMLRYYDDCRTRSGGGVTWVGD